MSYHTPTNWQNYPATITPITAAELLRMDKLGSEAYDLIDYALDRVVTRTQLAQTSMTVEQGDTLISGNVCPAPSGFDVDNDGLIVRINGAIVALSDYTISTGLIHFDDDNVAFNVGDVVTFNVYKQGQGGTSLTSGTSIQLGVGVASGSSQGISQEVNDD